MNPLKYNYKVLKSYISSKNINYKINNFFDDKNVSFSLY